MSVPLGHFKFWFCYSNSPDSLLHSEIVVPRFHVRVLPSEWSYPGSMLAFYLLPSVITLPRFPVAFATLSFEFYNFLPRFHVGSFFSILQLSYFNSMFVLQVLDTEICRLFFYGTHFSLSTVCNLFSFFGASFPSSHIMRRRWCGTQGSLILWKGVRKVGKILGR